MSAAIGGGIPLCIIANTVKGRGISFAENNPMYHYKGQIDDELMAQMEAALDEQAKG
jgi:transketolase